MAQVSSLIQTALENTSVQPTHVVYGDGNQEYQIKHGQTGKFWKTIGTLVDEKPGKVQLTIGETIGAESPLVLNLDIVLDKSLKFPEIQSITDHHLWEFLYEFIATVQQLMVDLIDDLPVAGRWAVLLATPREVQLSGRFHWLYRIHFPLCHLDTAWQHAVFLPELHSVCRQVRVGSSERLLSECLPDSFRLCADWADVVTLPQGSLPLYRSRKSQLMPELDYAMAFSDISNLGEDQEPDELDPRTAFPIIRHQHFETGQCRLPEVYVKGNVSQNHSMAFMLSQWYAPECLYQAKTSGAVSRVLSPNTTAWDKRLSTSAQSTPHQGVAESLLPLLAPKRFQEEHTWMDIGRALYVTYVRAPRGLALWQKYTEMHSKGVFTYAECARQYNDCLCDSTIITYRTIGFYAREDSPEAYAAWHRTWCENDLKVIYDEPQPTHADIAALIFKRYWLELVYEKGAWYKYLPSEGGWDISHKRDVIAVSITNDFIPYVYGLKDELSLQQRAAAIPDKDSYDKPIVALTKMIKKLKDESFFTKSIALAQTRCIYQDDGFASMSFQTRLDFNPRLIRLPGGGVLEALSKSVVHRRGKPEDYLTMVAGVPYDETFTWDSPEVKAYTYWIKQIFEEDELIDYNMRLFASVLRGGNNDKVIPIWLGKNGNEGKSTLMNCIKKALRMYHVELPTSAVTKGKSSAGSATPEIIPMLKARMACMKEPDPDEVFQIGQLKAFSGDSDSMYYRGLFSNSQEAKVYGKIFVHCNEVPPTNSPADQGTKNRIVIVPFKSIWSSEAPESVEEQRKLRHYRVDNNFNDNIYNYAKAWLWVAVQYYPKYAATPMNKLPPAVKRATDEYWDTVNYYSTFRNDMLEADPKGTVTVTEMYETFIKFLETDFQKKTGKPNKVKFRDNMKKVLAGSEFKKETFYGWKMTMNLA